MLKLAQTFFSQINLIQVLITEWLELQINTQVERNKARKRGYASTEEITKEGNKSEETLK